MGYTSPVTAAAIAEIKAARRAGYRLNFYTAAVDSGPIAYFYSEDFVYEIFADGHVERVRLDRGEA